LPANANTASFPLMIRSNAWLPAAQTVAVTLRHGSGYSAGASNTVHFVLPARAVRFIGWQAYHFTEAELLDDSVSGLLAAPAGDDVPNLLKYAFSLKPWETRTPADFPAATLSGEHLTLVYTRSKWLSDVLFHVEASGELDHWSSHPDEVEVVEVLDLGDYERVTVRDRQRVSEADQRFLRLKIELLP
jgi:hypothetical protein